MTIGDYYFTSDKNNLADDSYIVGVSGSITLEGQTTTAIGTEYIYKVAVISTGNITDMNIVKFVDSTPFYTRFWDGDPTLVKVV